MKSLFTLDIGNTNPHVAHFENGELKGVSTFEKFRSTFPPQSLAPKSLVISQVGATPQGLEEYRDKVLPITKREEKQFLGMPLNYEMSLGQDRLYEARFLFEEAQTQHLRLLNINAGTFITLDLITPEGFLGGLIAPGVRTFLDSYQKGAQLPLVAPHKLQRAIDLPSTTEQAIARATGLYLSSLIEVFIEQTGPNKIIFTGGSAQLLSELVSCKLETEQNPHLIHHALYFLGQKSL